MIDVFNKKISLEVGNEKIAFDIKKSMKFSTSAHDTCHSFDFVDLTIHDNVQENIHKDQLDSFLLNPVEGYQPNNDEIGSFSMWDEEKSDAKDELRRSLETSTTSELGYDLDNLESDFDKNPMLFAASLSSLRSSLNRKRGMTVITNEKNELVPTTTVAGCRVCIDYRKINDATRKDHFPLPFIDQMLERLLAHEDQYKTMFTCPYETFAFIRMPFGLCNALATFQRCMMAIFHDMCNDFMEVVMDDFSVFSNSFNSWLSNLSKMLARYKEKNLVLNWEKFHIMVKEGIVLGHKTSSARIEVDKAKVDMIAKLPYHTNVKGIKSFIGHDGFYRRDYVPKWVESESLHSNDARVEVRSLRKMFSRFGVPKALSVIEECISAILCLRKP
ncbi:reverse transcriptase domain-containing protein [Tanacetum coccineum]